MMRFLPRSSLLRLFFPIKDELAVSLEGLPPMLVAPVYLSVSLPKTRFEHSDGVVRQGLDSRQCLRIVRRAVSRAHPYRAKRGFEPHYNRSRISRGFAEGAQR